MKRMLAGMMVLGAMAASVFAGSECLGLHDHDYTLSAYKLTKEQENMFFVNDGDQVSAFWHAWDSLRTLGPNSLDQEVIDCRENFAWGLNDCQNSPEENRLTVRAAWGERGVYLLFIVDDNEWMMAEDNSLNAHFWDNVEIFFDKQSAQQLYSVKDASNFFDYSLSQLTRTTRQIQIPFIGQGGAKPDKFDFLRANHDLGGWETSPDYWMVLSRGVSIATFGSEYGIYLQVAYKTNTRKMQEWVIPWEEWGGDANGRGRGFGRLPNEGDRLAVTFGYNDMDPNLDKKSSAIRWRNRKDPWIKEVGDCDNGLTRDAWGDIQFAKLLNDALTTAGKGPLTSSNVNQWNRTYTGQDYQIPANPSPPILSTIARNLSRNYGSRPLSAAAKTEFYSITGRKITGAKALTSSSIVVRRDVDAKGKTVASKLIAK